MWTLWERKKKHKKNKEHSRVVKSILLPAAAHGLVANEAALLLLFMVICLFQTPGRGHPDGAEPSGELWTSRSPADQTGDPHHPPLCWQRPRRLAHTAEEPTGHGGVGGECSHCVLGNGFLVLATTQSSLIQWSAFSFSRTHSSLMEEGLKEGL